MYINFQKISTDNSLSFHVKDLTNSFLCCHTIMWDILVFIFLVKWHCHYIPKQYLFSNHNVQQSLASYLGYIPEKQYGWRELWC